MISSDSAMDGDRGSPPLDHGGPTDRPFEPMPASVLEGSVVDRFEDIARRHSTRLAVSDTDGNVFSYAHFARLVDRVATATAAACAGRPGPVAILLHSDAYFPAALLGVLTAGHSYVPLDAAAAIDRNRLIAIQSTAVAVISVGELAGTIRALFPQHIPVLDVDALGEAPTADPRRPGPDDLSFIIYTSGSTGMPKGVYQNHRNLLHSIMQTTNSLHVNEHDKVMFARSPSFIGATNDILLALLNGASVHVLPPLKLQPAGLVEEIQARGITVFRASPTLMRRIAGVLPASRRLDSVRVAQLLSERAEWSDFDIFRRIFPFDAHLAVIMNATEGDATFWYVDDAIRPTAAFLPVGRPVADRTVTIVGDDGHPVPEGWVGEIFIASRYLALGYWRDAAATARTFAAHPGEPDIRIYKTGDLGRRRPDGLFEHVGRKDNQVKLHGHRIEPAEIESALRNYPGVADAAIVARKNESGVVRALAAYVEAVSSVRNLSRRDLTTDLAKHLPGYMVPAAITIVDALPRLANLKIDRLRLTEIDAQCLAEAANPINDPLAKEVAGIFASVIGVDGATLDDNVLSLGGDSLQAINVAIALESRFQLAIPTEIFQSTETIRALAEWIASQKARAQSPVTASSR